MSSDLDFTKLESTLHMLQWLSKEPFRTIAEEITSVLNQSVSGAALQGFKVVSEPDWLTGALPSSDESAQAIVVRAGVAFPFELRVVTPSKEVFDLRGVFSWVGIALNRPDQAKQRTWFDIDCDMSSFGSGGALRERMYFE
jgi:hypothetical protein